MNAPYISKASEASKIDAGGRDLKVQCEKLHKELERKEARNEKLTREVQQIRASFSNHEVEHNFKDSLKLFYYF